MDNHLGASTIRQGTSHKSQTRTPCPCQYQPPRRRHRWHRGRKLATITQVTLIKTTGRIRNNARWHIFNQFYLYMIDSVALKRLTVTTKVLRIIWTYINKLHRIIRSNHITTQQEKEEREDSWSLNKSNLAWCSPISKVDLSSLTSILQPVKKGPPRIIWLRVSSSLL